MSLSLYDVIEVLCAQGFLRQATRLFLASKELAAAIPIGTAKQIFDAAGRGDKKSLVPYLEYWRGSTDSGKVLNWQNPKDKKKTCLIVACENGRREAVELLLTMVPFLDVNLARGYLESADSYMSGATAMTHAALAGHSDVVRMLIGSKGIDVNARQCQSSFSPLQAAAYRGHKAIVDLLLACWKTHLELEPGFGYFWYGGKEGEEAYREWKASDLASWTPLQLAADGNHTDIVEALTAALQRRELEGKAADEIGRCCRIDDLINLSPLLKQWSGNPYVVNGTSERSPILLQAVARNRTEIVRALASTEGADIEVVAEPYHDRYDDFDEAGNNVDLEFKTPLFVAYSKGNEEIKEILRNAGASELSPEQGVLLMIKALKKNDNNSLLQCLLRDFEGVVSVLQCRSLGSFCPLYAAVHEGNEEAVTMLVATPGVDVNADRIGVGKKRLSMYDSSRSQSDDEYYSQTAETALALAYELGNEGIARVLKATGAEMSLDEGAELLHDAAINAASACQDADSVNEHNVHMQSLRLLLRLYIGNAEALNWHYDWRLPVIVEDVTNYSHCLEVVRLLASTPGIEMNLRADLGNDYLSPLGFAIVEGHGEVEAILREHGARISAEEACDMICKAASGNSLAILTRLLREWEGDVVALNGVQEECSCYSFGDDDYSPLRTAVKHGHKESLQLLVETRGVRKSAFVNGKTVLDVALEKLGEGEEGFHEIVTILRGAGAMTATTFLMQLC